MPNICSAADAAQTHTLAENFLSEVISQLQNSLPYGQESNETSTQLPQLTSYNQILPYSRFMTLYKSSNRTTKESAGTLILSEDLNNILLVRGRFSKKWGPPKGHRDGPENNLQTALRETSEEIGHSIQLKANLLPYIVINKIKLYCLTLPQKTPFKTRDPTEIINIKWFNIDHLKNSLKVNPNQFNGSIRGIFDKPQTLKTIIHKITSFKINYAPTLDGFINEHFQKVIDVLHEIQGKQQSPSQNFHYICFYIVQRIYNNIFTNSDLIAFIRESF